jgi:hypothetical protein
MFTLHESGYYDFNKTQQRIGSGDRHFYVHLLTQKMPLFFRITIIPGCHLMLCESSEYVCIILNCGQHLFIDPFMKLGS